jgi:hypothetical protein
MQKPSTRWDQWELVRFSWTHLLHIPKTGTSGTECIPESWLLISVKMELMLSASEVTCSSISVLGIVLLEPMILRTGQEPYKTKDSYKYQGLKHSLSFYCWESG